MMLQHLFWFWQCILLWSQRIIFKMVDNSSTSVRNVYVILSSCTGVGAEIYVFSMLYPMESNVIWWYLIFAVLWSFSMENTIPGKCLCKFSEDTCFYLQSLIFQSGKKGIFLLCAQLFWASLWLCFFFFYLKSFKYVASSTFICSWWTSHFRIPNI